MFQRAGRPAQASSRRAATAEAYAALPQATSSTRSAAPDRVHDRPELLEADLVARDAARDGGPDGLRLLCISLTMKCS